MKVAIGLKAHSGWAVLVAVGKSSAGPVIVDRRRIELVSKGDASWAKQPYHAAVHLKSNDARDLIKRATRAAQRAAEQEIRAAIKRITKQNDNLTVVAVLSPNPMPDWTVDQILAVHFRMHKAEGVLFPTALSWAAEKCGLKVLAVPETTLNEFAVEASSTPLSQLTTEITRLGKSLGPPWGKDQKNAALAAVAALNYL